MRTDEFNSVRAPALDAGRKKGLLDKAMVKISNARNVAFATAILTASETIGQSMLRKFYDGGLKWSQWYLPIGCWLLYGLCCATLIWSYSYSDIAAVETIWDAGTSVAVPLVGFLVFKNKVNALSLSGILLTILGIFLIGEGGVEEK